MAIKFISENDTIRKPPKQSDKLAPNKRIEPRLYPPKKNKPVKP